MTFITQLKQCRSTVRLIGIFVSVLLLSGGISASAEETDCLVVHKTDGTKTSYVLSETPKVTFLTGSLHIEGSSFSDDHALADVQKFTFEKVTALTDITTGEQRITLTDNILTVEGFQQESTLSVFNVSGICMLAADIDSDGCARVDLSPLAPGVYVVSIENSKTFKILKK